MSSSKAECHHFNQEEIKRIIPHRDPFLLLDEVVSLIGDIVHARKKVTGEEDFFKGHFPQAPVMPGVLIVEAMAQAGAVCVLSRPEFSGKIAYFAGADKVRFKRKVLPGDLLDLHVELTKLRGKIGFGEARAEVNGAVVATAKFTFAVE